MIRLAVAAMAATLLLGIAFAAQDTPEKKPKKNDTLHKKLEATWSKSEGDVKVTFQIKKHVLRCIMEKGDEKLTCDADYGLTKDGYVFGRLNKIEKSNTDQGPNVGELFSFRAAVTEGTLTISDLTAPGNGDARKLIEGDYKKVPGKKK
jgi:hypothetical protein